MSIFASRRIAIPSTVTALLLFVAAVASFWSYGVSRVRVVFADEQTRIFEEMRTRALASSSPSDIVSSLQYVVYYYPSGTKQEEGSRLDRVVERHRQLVVRELIGHLRRTTGQDLGDNPEPWIERFSKK